MAIRKLDDGRWLVDIRPQGTDGKRIRRKFCKKAEASIFEHYILVNYHNKDWIEKPPDRRRLTELLEIWWIYHGKHHEGGQTERTRLEAIIKQFGRMGVSRIDQLTKRAVVDYRIMMMNEGLKPSSVNRQIFILSGMFTKLIGAERFFPPNPISEIKRLKEARAETAYLSDDEIRALLASLEGDHLNIAVLCLSTGARWSEAAELKAEHIAGNVITFMKTKNGRRRHVPVSDDVLKKICKKTKGRLFLADYAKFRETLKSVVPGLPKGQAAHVLRHTFATHFMMNGGNIITLQRILGHATIQQTMTYAHFSPDFLNEAIRFNPLGGKATI
ncbi:tyrosine-type recombinase/integrase [Salmonella enterica subsp. enterica]|nr:tyrosine-type recombinase/integrase [Salmonella enterica subsp. enterica serovar Brazzaville]